MVSAFFDWSAWQCVRCNTRTICEPWHSNAKEDDFMSRKYVRAALLGIVALLGSIVAVQAAMAPNAPCGGYGSRWSFARLTWLSLQARPGCWCPHFFCAISTRGCRDASSTVGNSVQDRKS